MQDNIGNLDYLQGFWDSPVGTNLDNLWNSLIVDVLPNIIVALLVFILGWLVAMILERWVSQLIRSLQLDKALKSVGAEQVVSRAGFSLDSGAFLGALVKWFVVAVFLLASFDLLGLSQVNDFLKETVIVYLPKVFVASLTLILGAVIADVIKKLIAGSSRALGARSASLFGSVAQWAIWISALFIALRTLGIAEPFVNTIFTGVIAMLTIAGGLAFGLGGRDAAARYLEHLRQDITERR
ncbi:MAG: hypothetical protein AAB468_01890 [Patescibacteria group bacterium]